MLNSVALAMPPLGRGKIITFEIVLRSKTQINTSVKQLPGKGGLSAKTVHRPLRGGAERPAQLKQGIPSTDDVERDGQAETLCQSYLRLEDFYLHLLRAAAVPHPQRHVRQRHVPRRHPAVLL